MKPKIWIFIILIIVSLFIFGYFKSIPGVEDQAENIPKIEINPKDFYFGEIDYGQVVNYSFLVKNVGSEILEIKRVSTSCACTTAEIKKEKINPNETAELQVVYDTGAMSGPHGMGEQERIIYVKSNDPINPQTEVMIYANVK